VEVGRRGLTTLFSSTESAVALLGIAGGNLILVQQAKFGEPYVFRSWSNGTSRELFSTRLIANSWSYIRSAHAITFSRRDALDVENIFMRDLQAGKEIPVTSNGIQGIGFSPVSDSGGGLLVYSQQLSNKDVGIIRLDSR
jgi:hypothetical protein